MNPVWIVYLKRYAQITMKMSQFHGDDKSAFACNHVHVCAIWYLIAGCCNQRYRLWCPISSHTHTHKPRGGRLHVTPTLVINWKVPHGSDSSDSGGANAGGSYGDLWFWHFTFSYGSIMENWKVARKRVPYAHIVVVLFLLPCTITQFQYFSLSICFVLYEMLWKILYPYLVFLCKARTQKKAMCI